MSDETKTTARPRSNFKRAGGRRGIDAAAMELIDEWCARLPPVLSRKRLDWFLGGIVSRKHIANLDSAGEGPTGRFLVGRETMYETRQLLQWLAETRGLKRLTGIRSLEGVIPCQDEPDAQPRSSSPRG